MDYYSAIKKNGMILFVATWTDLEVVVILSEVSQTEKDKYHMIPFICGILKQMIQMSLPTKQTKDSQRTNLRFPRGKDVEKGKLGSLGCVHTTIFTVDNQQGPTI